MKHRAYLTIDDSPSPHTRELTDWLSREGIPAVLFCRGDRMEWDQGAVVAAIQKGMIVANHSYSHRPAGDLSFEEVVAEIEKTERLIDAAYRESGAARRGKYFRFPYLDKGDGDRLERRFGEIIANPESVSLARDDKAQKLQAWLKAEGFTQPFRGVTHPLYKNPDVAQAADCLFTYSSCDWMLTDRHRGQWDYKNPEDLKRKIDDDPFLCHEGGVQITLFHDQPEIDRVVIALIRHMRDEGFVFLDCEGDVP